MIRRPPRSTLSSSSAASDVYKRQPWKGAARNTYLAARELRAFTPPVLLIRDDQSSNPTVVQQTIDLHVAWLGSYNIDCGVLLRSNVESGVLAQSRLVILPYNENISDTEWTALESFVAAGGKLLVYYLCLLYTSDAADEEDSVDLGGRRI